MSGFVYLLTFVDQNADDDNQSNYQKENDHHDNNGDDCWNEHNDVMSWKCFLRY